MMLFAAAMLIPLAAAWGPAQPEGRGQSASTPVYYMRGQLTPASSASVSLHGATTPFHASTLAGPDGRFRFKSITEGTYTLVAFFPGRGEIRKTIVITPGHADSKRRI